MVLATENPDTSNTDSFSLHLSECNYNSAESGYNDFDYQKMPVPDQLRNEVFIKLHSERWRLNPTPEILDILNTAWPYTKNPTTAEDQSAKLKTPFGSSWNELDERFTADEIDEYRRNSIGFGNYALIPTTLTVMDADSVSELEKYGAISTLPQTFRVKSGRISGDGMHIYLKVRGIPEDKRVKIEFDGSLGDIRFAGHNSYVVAPYSMHPSGRRYMPENPSAAVGSIEYSDLMEIIDKIPKSKDKEKPAKSPQSFAERIQKAVDGTKYTGGNVMIELRNWWSQRQDIESMIPGNYRKVGDRWLSPNSESGCPGIEIYYDGGIGKIHSWHKYDGIFSKDHLTSPFDLLVIECNGVVRDADKIVIKEAKKYNFPLYLKWATANAEWKLSHRKSAGGVSV